MGCKSGVRVNSDPFPAEKDLQTERERLKDADASLAAIRQQRLGAEAEFRTQILRELSAVKEKQAGIEQDLKKATRRGALQVLTAPVDGTVQELKANTVGGVVQPAETLMLIVPVDAVLEIEAILLNKDAGFVAVGQPAEIKLDPFPYTIYGLIDGTVREISADAVIREKEGLVYVARVQLSRTTIDVEGRKVALSPGMGATVEIKTGKRRVIEYLLDPLIRYKLEAMRER